MGAWVPVLIAAGLLGLGGGVREAHTLSRLRRIGVRTNGIVVRVESKATEDRSRMYTPIVEFVDGSGERRQVRSRVSSTRRPPELGTAIPVVYPPNRPEKARFDTRGDKMSSVGISLVCGVAFLAAGIYLAVR